MAIEIVILIESVTIWALVGFIWLQYDIHVRVKPLPSDALRVIWFIFIRGPVCWVAASVVIVRTRIRIGRWQLHDDDEQDED